MNYKKSTIVIIFALLFILSCKLGLFSPSWRRGGSTSASDTIYVETTTIKTDTVMVDKPTLIERMVVRSDTVLLSRADTVATHDSVLIAVPIEQRHYKDTTYDAWISGFRPSLDSIRIYHNTVTTMRTTTIRKRWGIGVQGGYGMTPEGFQPYVGVGITYNLF